MGELGLMPDQFWSLTYAEFQVKHRAFTRAEDRQRALVIDLALRTAQYKDSDRDQMWRDVHALRRYPEKAWLK